jgi:RsiW-degrading membrane proteinase PrsW (M82 family)
MLADESLLIWGMVFGSIGLGFFIYGKKQKKPVPLAVGIGLFVFPYFVTTLTQMFIVGTILVLTPYFIRT